MNDLYLHVLDVPPSSEGKDVDPAVVDDFFNGPSPAWLDPEGRRAKVVEVIRSTPSVWLGNVEAALPGMGAPMVLDEETVLLVCYVLRTEPERRRGRGSVFSTLGNPDVVEAFLYFNLGEGKEMRGRGKTEMTPEDVKAIVEGLEAIRRR
jgi:hypothetical protein